MNDRERRPSEVLRRGYSDEEINNIYELGRLFLENGDLRRGESIMNGLTEIAPDFAPAWLGMSYIHMHSNNNDEATYCARQALRVQPEFTEAMLFLISCLLTNADYNSAGTYLGEVAEKVEGGGVDEPKLIRFYKAQMARYQQRR